MRAATERLASSGLGPRLTIDASHGNSNKDHVRQAEVATLLSAQIAADGAAVAGVMLESNLVAGAQSLDVEQGPAHLARGQSVTDKCMDWETTDAVLRALAAGARGRRAAA